MKIVKKIKKYIYVCSGHGKLSFPLINKVLFVIGSEFYLKSGFELMMFHLLQTRGDPEGMLPQGNLALFRSSDIQFQSIFVENFAPA